MSRDPKSARNWRRRRLLTSVAGLAVTAGLAACESETSAIGAPSARARDDNMDADDAPPSVAGLLAYRSARNFGSTAPAGSTYSIFQGFTRGAVPPGNVARIAVHGVPVEKQQCDNRVAWPDGSLRCATFTWAHPRAIPSGDRDRITLAAAPGSWNNTPSATLKDLLSHDYRMQVVVGGVTYSLLANNEVRAGTRVTRIRAGNACTAWKIWGDFRAGTSASAPIQGQMWGKMFLYVTHDGHVRVEDEIYCNKIANSAAIPITSYALLDGGNVLFRNATPFTLHTRNKIATYDSEGRDYFSGPDISKVVWAFPRPVARNPATTGLYDAMITWWNKWTPTYIAAFPRPLAVPYAPNADFHIIFSGAVDGTGNHDWLGPMASYSVQAMLNGRYDYHRQDRLKALGGWGQALYWCADSDTGLPPVFTNTHYRGLSAPIPNVGWGLAATLQMTGGANPGSTGDASHAPLFWWWQYLSTGSEQALENIMEQAVGVLGCDVAQSGIYQRNPKFANGKQYFGSYCNFPQSRAVGWAFRNFSNAHWVTPDAHPMKRYLNDVVQVQYDSTQELLKQMAPTWGPLAQWNENGNGYPPHAPAESPWMGDYRVTSVLMDYRRGRIPHDHLAMVHVIKHQYGRMVDGSFYNGAGAYRLSPNVGPNPMVGAPFATSWDQVYGFQDPPNLIHPLIDNPPRTSGLRNQEGRTNGEATYPADHKYVGHTYENIALCAGHCGVIAGLGHYPEAVVAYLDPLIDNASERRWGETVGAQAWRIRTPA